MLFHHWHAQPNQFLDVAQVGALFSVTEREGNPFRAMLNCFDVIVVTRLHRSRDGASTDSEFFRELAFDFQMTSLRMPLAIKANDSSLSPQ